MRAWIVVIVVAIVVDIVFIFISAICQLIGTDKYWCAEVISRLAALVPRYSPMI